MVHDEIKIGDYQTKKTRYLLRPEDHVVYNKIRFGSVKMFADRLTEHGQA